MLICDLIAPQREEAEEVFRASWNESARERAAQAGHPALWELFENEKWNCYRYPDPVDKPSPLSAQLRWLAEAGFPVVDCYWLRAGHAVYGGYRRARRRGDRPSYQRAQEIARIAVEKTR